MHIKVLKAHQYAIVVCKTGGCVSGDTSCGDYSSTIQKRLIIFAQIPLKTKLFMFKTDIANYRNKELKDEIIVRLGFWM